MSLLGSGATAFTAAKEPALLPTFVFPRLELTSVQLFQDKLWDSKHLFGLFNISSPLCLGPSIHIKGELLHWWVSAERENTKKRTRQFMSIDLTVCKAEVQLYRWDINPAFTSASKSNAISCFIVGKGQCRDLFCILWIQHIFTSASCTWLYYFLSYCVCFSSHKITSPMRCFSGCFIPSFKVTTNNFWILKSFITFMFENVSSFPFMIDLKMMPQLNWYDNSLRKCSVA